MSYIDKYLAKKEEVIWMEVDLQDKELPTGHMGDSAEELAKECGVQPCTIYSARSRALKKGQKCRYVKVVL